MVSVPKGCGNGLETRGGNSAPAQRGRGGNTKKDAIEVVIRKSQPLAVKGVNRKPGKSEGEGDRRGEKRNCYLFIFAGKGRRSEKNNG